MMKYFIYARKSSEGEDRQVTSIDDQIEECLKMARDNNLEVVDIISESKSAKAPGRNLFNQMIERIHKGEANGIISWKLNRLARNPIDGSQIIWLLQEKIIEHVKLIGQNYYPTDNLVMMYIEFGMASQYSKDLSVDIRRGMLKKAKRGWLPITQLPIGYIHNAKSKTLNEEIVIDKKVFKNVKYLWSLLIEKKYSISELKRIGDSLDIRRKNKGLLSLTSYHRLFRNEFYSGYFTWKDENENLFHQKGKHTSMISRNLFLKAQKILDQRGSVRITSFHTYSGIFQCGECSCYFTPTVVHRAYCKQCKYKFSIKKRNSCSKCNTAITKTSNFTFLNKTYYGCTKKRGTCSQKYILEHELEKQLIEYLSSIEIDSNIYKWCLNIIKTTELNAKQNPHEMDLLNSLNKLETKFNKLVNLRADDELSKEEYIQFSQPIKQQIETIKNELISAKASRINWKTEMENAINITQNITDIFKKSDSKGKREIVLSIGLNPIIMNKKAYFVTPKSILRVQEFTSNFNNKKDRLEPSTTVINQRDLLGINLPIPLCADSEQPPEH